MAKLQDEWITALSLTVFSRNTIVLYTFIVEHFFIPSFVDGIFFFYLMHTSRSKSSSCVLEQNYILYLLHSTYANPYPYPDCTLFKAWNDGKSACTLRNNISGTVARDAYPNDWGSDLEPSRGKASKPTDKTYRKHRKPPYVCVCVYKYRT